MLHYYDAHNHFQDERLAAHCDDVAQSLLAMGLRRAVVTGSGVQDWGGVAALTETYAWVLPSFGVHPWYVGDQPEDWFEKLAAWLQKYPQAGVGEIGLDRWLPTADVPLQVQMFRKQWLLAHQLRRVATVHCLQAFGLLEETLLELPRLDSGFLLHSYCGPLEMVPAFTRLGAYFSVSPYFLHERKAHQWQTFKHVPLDRLLLETDAPDMWPPMELNPHALYDAEGKPMNHPANIVLMYEHVAMLRQMPVEELAGQVAENFARLFGSE